MRKYVYIKLRTAESEANNDLSPLIVPLSELDFLLFFEPPFRYL